MCSAVLGKRSTGLHCRTGVFSLGHACKAQGTPLSRAGQRAYMPIKQRGRVTTGGWCSKNLEPSLEEVNDCGRAPITAGQWDFLGCSTQGNSEIFIPGLPLHCSGPYPSFPWPLLLIHCGHGEGAYASSVWEKLLLHRCDSICLRTRRETEAPRVMNYLALFINPNIQNPADT